MNLSLLNHKIIITENKEELIELKSINPFLNFKILTKKELIEKCYFTYDNRAKIYLTRLNYKIENTDEILNNLYFLKDNISTKIDNLINIKTQLEQNNLLIKNNIFKKYINNKDIIIYGYEENDPELNIIVNELNLNAKFYNNETISNNIFAYEFSTIEDEIRYIFEQISLLIKQGIQPNQIKIATENTTYINQLKKYEKFYSFKFNVHTNESLFLTKDYKLFKSYLTTTLCEEAFSLIYDRITHKKEFDKLIEKYIEVKDYIHQTEIETYLDYIAKKINIESVEYENGISIIPLSKCKKNDYVLLIGFILNSYPIVFKDDDYLLDNEKCLLNISTSKNKQNLNEKEIIKSLSNAKNLKISYSKKNDNDIYYPSLLIQKLKIPVLKYEFTNTIFSKKHFDFFMGKIIDEYENFSFISPYLKSISKNEINYLSYNNKFNGTSIDLQNLKLSATSIDLYNKCAFHYYLSKIVFIDSFEETLSSKIGNIAHKILENIVKNQTTNLNEIKKEFSLTPRENIIIDSLKPQLDKMIGNFIEFKNTTQLKNMISEDFNFSYKISNKSTLEGRIDLIISNDNNFAIIDHKTSSTKFDQSIIKFGYSLQLPIYYLLTKEGNDSFKSKDFLGFYIHTIMSKDFYEEKYDYLLFNGITTCEKAFSLIQNEKSFIKKISKKNTSIDEEEFKNIIDITKQKIEETSINILANNFTINPKMINNSDTSCSYCPFNNVCYHTYKDYVYLSKEEEEK